MTSAELQCTEAVDSVVKELQEKIETVQEATKGNHKTAKVIYYFPHTNNC